MKKILFLFAFLFCLSLNASADVLYLKNGMKIKGKLLEGTESTYKINVGGLPFTYLKTEVDKVIEGDEPIQPQAPVTGSPNPEALKSPAASAVFAPVSSPSAAVASPEPVKTTETPAAVPLAQTPGNIAAADVSPEKETLIRKLLEVNGAQEYMVKLFNQIIKEVPEKDRALAEEVLKVDEIIKRIVPIYAKYYTDQELRDIISFYSSPVGVKHLANTPKVMEDTMLEVTKYFDEKTGANQMPPDNSEINNSSSGNSN